MGMEEEKRRIRQEMRALCRAMDGARRQRGSDAMTRAVLESDVYRGARRVFLYLSTPPEPDTGAIVEDALASGKAVYVPKCTAPHEMQAVRIFADTRYAAGAFGIREPEDISDCAAPEDMDLCLVPCVSVTMDGARLGHGGGYYDAFLSRCGGYKLCLCWDACLSPVLPTEPWDVSMDAVCTERGLFPCR